jgi:NMD protein affecting ribosome stability and mRNA decay
MKPNRSAASPPSLARTQPYSPKRDAGIRSANDEDDAYRNTKPTEPAQCPKCKAVFTEGRWTWENAPDDAIDFLCPACQRINDKFPAGYVTIKGEFFKEHRDEIVHLIESHEKREKAARPLQRIMGMDEKKDGTVEITTTDSHLARGIAEAIHDAYKGDLKVRYSRDENLVRAVWKR